MVLKEVNEMNESDEEKKTIIHKYVNPSNDLNVERYLNQSINEMVVIE